MSAYFLHKLFYWYKLDMGWVLIPAVADKPLALYPCTDSIKEHLHTSCDGELHYDPVSADVAFVTAKNSGNAQPNVRARTLMAQELGDENQCECPSGDVAVVAACSTLWDGYAELLWVDCESLRDFLA